MEEIEEMKKVKNGLVLEGGSLDALIERVRFAAPELIELNKSPTMNSLYFTVERHEKVFA